MIAAIVLAAGKSTRMRTQKLLLPWDGQTVIGHIVDQVLASRVDRVFVVAPTDSSAVQSVLSGRPVIFVTNPAPDGDMLGSIRCGLRALPPDVTAVLVVLGDQPSLSSSWIDALLDAFHATGRGIVVPTYAGRRGHPLLSSARYIEELLTSHDDLGLRGLLQAHPKDIHEIDLADAAVLADMDHPEDYDRELRRDRARAVPPC